MHRLLHSGRRALLALVLAATALLLGVPGANAALVTDADYTVAAATAGCGYLGQTDNNGVFYTWCNGKIARWDKAGTRLADIAMPAGVGAGDLAPSPDGTYLYVSQGGNPVRRLNRNAALGTYALDATWQLAQLSVWNVKSATFGAFIATDGRGDIYVSNGSLTVDGQRSIAKFSPAGTFITAFGDWGKEPGNWVTNQDIAVSRDGRRVFVGENCGTNCIYGTAGYNASRITRYDFNPGGTYRFSRIISAQGRTGTSAFPTCEAPGAVHSNYSLTLDFWDNLYATSTTCGRIQMYHTDVDPAKDAFLRSVARWDDQAVRNHYVSSDWAGRIRAYQWDRVFTPRVVRVPATPLPALEPLPTPDVQAPRLLDVVLPATTTTQSVNVAITATDDRGVAEMQLAHEDGVWGPWQPFVTPVAYPLTAGFGVKGVYVRVRDMGGNESAAVYRTTGYRAANDPPPPAGDLADPILTRIGVPALSATREINVLVDATDDTGVTQVRLANEDGTWGAWRPYAATVPWVLSANVGPKRVYVQVRDAAGRESAALSSASSYQLDAPPGGGGGGGGVPDAIAPQLTSLTLPAETTTRAIQATLVAADNVGVAQVRFANEDGTWTAWQAWATPAAWTLTDGYGGKLVYAQVRDAAGNESISLTARTSYVRTVAGPVDAADPTLTRVELPATTNTQLITLRLTAADDVAVTQVRLANEDGTWGAWKAFAPTVEHTLSAGRGFKVVYVQVRDAAGHESTTSTVRTEVIA
ncbi:MAG: Ig-like surface protein [Thermoleophilia bacterium]|nr:Ig-like surface protein [Thermoleophilia bacterium]